MKSKTTRSVSQPSTAQVFLDRGSELVWLAFLLTGDMSLGRDVVGEALDARDPTAPFFEQWMAAWGRKLVIASPGASAPGPLGPSQRFEAVVLRVEARRSVQPRESR